MMAQALFALCIAAFVLVNVRAQNDSVQSTFPHVYPNKPSGDYSPKWQKYFQVTEQLPNVTWTLSRNWAGNIPVQRAGHDNDTLFFWAFEKENGSLTAGANERLDKPWGIWLNGGPGSSSLAGLMLENGPIHVANDWSISKNNYSWDQLADYVWIDQPVGTGFATADKAGYVADEDQMGIDFFGFLANLVKVFPSLAKRPLYLTGESYAGTYIPYITKAYFGMANPPVNLAKIAIGDGTLGSDRVFMILPATNMLETYPQLIGYETDVYSYFREQEHLCGYDLNLTYPQSGYFSSLNYTFPTERNISDFLAERKTRFNKQSFINEAEARFAKRSDGQGFSKRDLTGRANGTIDGWYGCFLYDEMLDYALNFSFPWTLQPPSGLDFDVYNIPDALFPPAPQDPSVFLNDNRTIAAIHAPTNKQWVESIQYPFGSVAGGQDPSVEPMAFLTDLATNATRHGVSVVIYSGNDDSLVAHRGSEVVIQNTTFGGIQGFTRKPSTPWTDDAGNFAGIVHQERNWTYVLFKGAGHLVPFYQPAAAFTFAREFVLGSNQTGSVTNSSGKVVVVGGEVSSLAAAVMPGQAEIYYGSGTTQSTYTAPTATVASWNNFIATAAPSGDIIMASKMSSGHRTIVPVAVVPFVLGAMLWVLQ